MTIKDFLLACIVILAWGVNFVVIKFGVQDIPPFLLGCLRFVFVVFPAIFFIKRPPVPTRLILMYGLAISFGQFSLLFFAMYLGMPTGIASLASQAQVFFTLLLGVLFLKETLKIQHIMGMLVASMGLIILAISKAGINSHVPLIPFLFILAAALSWAIGNICNKVILKHANVNALSLVVWAGLVPIIPFFLCSVWLDGIDKVGMSLAHIQAKDIFVVFYLSIVCSLVGYGLWGYLLNKYETWRVAPLTLLIPVVGLITGFIVLGERLSYTQYIGVVVIGLGLCINMFGQRVFARFKRKQTI
ncbi:EamA family transporter [Acinetobacter rathckeae]|uniref:EamA family transporter n=1 Tax=Acinetobacter rathckeae TaxID=2605272 RepID=UPI0018A31628|nr:EamA family transporter [Acinetobacter rathckeae]MBF7688926.1 EamA family transporter [Acinetobacter rathckeae]MBF7696325.1 EamA family transporter [Acinetobacter rathckeae]